MGSSFDGLVEEFPGLGVDKFNSIAEVFLLTHFHADHLTGLSNIGFTSKVYCSNTTKKLIDQDENYGAVLCKLVGVPFNTPLNLKVKDREVRIIFIPAYHCPGASMILIEGFGRSVICTGDVRAEKWWVNTLPKNVYLFPYTTGQKKLDNIYLDTSFGVRGEPFINIITNEDAITTAIDLIKLYPLDDPDIQFYFADSTSGFEECWAQIINVINGKFHTGARIMKRIQSISKCDLYGSFADILMKAVDKEGPLFHACGNYPRLCKMVPCKFPVRIKQSIKFNILDLTGVFFPIQLSSLSEFELKNELYILDTTPKGNKIIRFRNRMWILRQDGQELLPSEIKLIFSRHSTYSEARYLVSLFAPKQVYPCVESETSWYEGFLMSRVFGDLCASADDVTQYTYDRRMAFSLGLPSRAVIDRPLKVINRWIFEDSKMEENFVHRFLKRKEAKNENLSKMDFKFRGIGCFSSPEKSIEPNSCQLHQFIMGRRQGSFKKMIEEQQKLYKEKYYNDVRYINNHKEYVDLELGSLYDYDSESIESHYFEDNSLNKSTESQQRREIEEYFHKIAKARPSLKRNVSALPGKRTSVERSVISSSFSSIEVSFSRNPISRSISSTRSIERVSKPYPRVNKAHVNQITQDLRNNPNKWFTMKLQSANNMTVSQSSKCVDS
ncbi:uncharacterized protein PRCAT00004719001 [Priceomyces carsonii]|uniref:uncharacterized protein n=1 Tax=Priceomyces carsonii TaxID=28549 RepID=UPI002ED9058D|nr:unnamed protein product [Priceomyces carsonii]